VNDDPAKSRVALTCLVLGLVTLAVFWPVGGFDFTNYDDEHYISQNAVVKGGLTLENIKWALTTTYFSYWHPLTWMSHMLDCQLFAENSGAHHLTSLFFHVLNTLLVFLVLGRMTGALGRSAFVAALFALHPLHVESVAWLAERKDVLSTFFWLLAIWAYARDVKRHGTGCSPLALAFFACGLMSKPVVVTLPCTLLLLDFWPLRRIAIRPSPDPHAAAEPKDRLRSSPSSHSTLRTLLGLIVEKLPFFAWSAGSCGITYFGTKAAGNTLSADKLSWSFRLTNVPVSYIRYIGKMIWPEDMTVLYPIPSQWAPWQVVGATLLLVCVSLAVVAMVRRAPYLLVGWLWYLGTLVPTLSLIAVGYQSMADRYTYVSLLGLFIMIAWGAADMATRWSWPKPALKAAAAVSIAGCILVTRLQLHTWRNSVSLWTHAVAATQSNAIAHYNLGHALFKEGQSEQPMRHYREALRIKPDYLDAHLNLGQVLLGMGRLEEATNQFAACLKIKPDYDKAHNNLGGALLMMDQPAQAVNEFTRALLSNPEYAGAHFNLGLALAKLGRFDEAIEHYAAALRLEPDGPATHKWMGKALSARNQPAEAASHYFQALRLNPNDAELHANLGAILVQMGRSFEGIGYLREAVQLDPALAEAHFELGLALAGQRQTAEAILEYREALRLKPDSPQILNNLAWILATSLAAEFRNGQDAVKLAERACDLTARKQVVLLGTLAAAYAEAGQFTRAAETAREARDLAASLQQPDLAAKNQELLQRFQAGQPCRE
jgi:tetratricopeptide (TPR) repeat protein